MRRFFVDPQLLQDDVLALPDEIVHHVRVLRLSSGDEILLLDGHGACCHCRLLEVTRHEVRVQVMSRWQEEDDSFPVQILQGLPKGDKIDLVLQKGTELGVSHFTPVIAGRSVPRGEAGRNDKRLERWQRIVQEAARQCRRPCLPQLDPPLNLSDAVHGCAAPLRLMLWEKGAVPLSKRLPADRPASAAVLVGPEGGFSEAEADLALAAGFLPVSLGPRILRTETAGIAVASVLQYLYGDFGRDPLLLQRRSLSWEDS